MYTSTRLDDYLTRRLQDASITALLAEGAAGIYNGIRPQSSGGRTAGPFLTFHQTGAVVALCLDGTKLGTQAEYVVQAWQEGDDLDSLQGLLDAVEARLDPPTATETVSGTTYTVLGQSAELQQIDVSQGVLYATAGGRWQVSADPA